MKPGLPSLFAFISLLALLTGGCASSGLWEEKSFREPSSPTNLKLAYDRGRKDVLVVYDEMCDRSEETRSRAFFLFQNVKRMNAGKRPAFVNPAAGVSLEPVPVTASEPLTEQQAALEFSAVAATNSADFKLFSKGREVGEFHLPVYKDGVWQTEKALLMPLALGADATVIGGYIWAESEFPGVDFSR